MTYIQYLIIFLLFFYCLGLYFYFQSRIKKDYFYTIVIKAFLKKQEKTPHEEFFSSFGLRKIIECLIHKRSKKALIYLAFARTGFAHAALRKQNVLKGILEAYNSPASAIKILARELRRHPKDSFLLSELASLYFIKGNLERAVYLFQRINDSKADRYAVAKKHYYLAKIALDNGDLLNASNSASLAAKLFRKSRACFEEAQAHMLLGIIYRVSMMEDISYFMFQTALDIFKKYHIAFGQADAYGNLGMLMNMSGRYKEAADYFDKALAINEDLKREEALESILNQISLTHLFKNDIETAETFTQDVLKVHKNNALSYEVLSNIRYQQRNWKESANFALKAAQIHNRNQNISGLQESLYLQSLALFEDEKLKESETVLRKIIDTDKKTPSCFHVANAYNLMGLIFLKKQDYKKAKTLFQQSLSQEQRNDRQAGIASDYANLGIVELCMGNKKEAKRHLKLALGISKSCKDNELSSLIENKLNRI